MTICPIAIAVGCRKCPAFKVCPLTKVLGDQPKAASVEMPNAARPKTKTKPKAASENKPAGGKRKSKF